MAPFQHNKDDTGSAELKGWHSRGYLPHLDNDHALQFVTFRLADSLPQSLIHELKRGQKYTGLKPEAVKLEKRKRIEQWLDAGHGCCALRHPAAARKVQDALFHFDGDRYRLLAWCIMPNHVHVLIEPRSEPGKIVQSWKSFIGRWALQRNAELELRVPGTRFWMADYWDRYIRDQNHLEQVIDYIHQNPIKAGLCKQPADWPWSSARERGAPAPQDRVGDTGD